MMLTEKTTLKNKIINYLIFNKREDKDIDNFINELEKTFVINRIANNRKYMVVISCLKEITANFYDELNRITNWNIVR